VLCAIRGHATWAGVLLGVAIANKDWAVVAVGPVWIALAADRLRALLLAAAVAVAMLAPFVIATGHLDLAGDTGNIFLPQQIWWFFGHVPHRFIHHVAVDYRNQPGWLAGRAHPLIAVIGLPLTLLAWRRRMRRDDVLLLLAMLLLLRCMLDPWDNPYYPLPFTIALVAWEATVYARVPIAAILACAGGWVVFVYLPAHVFAPNHLAIAFIVPSILALALIARVVYRVGEGSFPTARGRYSTTSSSLVKWLSTRAPSLSTTTRSSIRTPSSPGR
jgi:hypothetical protein